MSQQAKAKRQPLRKAALKKAEKRVRNESDQQASSKKQRPESKGRNTAEDSDEESDGDEEEDQELKNVNTQEYTFEFNDMKEDYSPGIKLILTATLVANPSKAYNLSDEIVKQDTVGTIVACEGENDVFAFATIMPSKLIKNDDFVKSIQQYFNSKGSEIPETVRKVFRRLENDADKTEVGFLIHGRFSNAPLELISQVHNNLLLDYEWAMDQKSSINKSSADVDWEIIEMFHQLKHLILITAATSEREIPSTENIRGRSDIFFENFEDECYFGKATAAFFVNLGTYFKPAHCVVMIIPIENLKGCVEEIVKLTG